VTDNLQAVYPKDIKRIDTRLNLLLAPLDPPTALISNPGALRRAEDERFNAMEEERPSLSSLSGSSSDAALFKAEQRREAEIRREAGEPYSSDIVMRSIEKDPKEGNEIIRGQKRAFVGGSPFSAETDSSPVVREHKILRRGRSRSDPSPSSVETGSSPIVQSCQVEKKSLFKDMNWSEKKRSEGGVAQPISPTGRGEPSEPTSELLMATDSFDKIVEEEQRDEREINENFRLKAALEKTTKAALEKDRDPTQPLSTTGEDEPKVRDPRSEMPIISDSPDFEMSKEKQQITSVKDELITPDVPHTTDESIPGLELALSNQLLAAFPKKERGGEA